MNGVSILPEEDEVLRRIAVCRWKESQKTPAVSHADAKASSNQSGGGGSRALGTANQANGPTLQTDQKTRRLAERRCKKTRLNQKEGSERSMGEGKGRKTYTKPFG